MKKKSGISMALLLIIGIPFLSAQEKKLSLSWSAGVEGHPNVFSRMSVIGVGLVLYQDGGLSLWNQFGLCNGVMVREDKGESYYKKVLFDKLSLGLMVRDDLLRPYGFIEGRVGTCGTDLWNFQENPPIWNIGLGAGLNIFATKHWSFFQEIGFLGNFYGEEFIPQQRFELGTMFHF